MLFASHEILFHELDGRAERNEGVSVFFFPENVDF
jgi:hypothetical protein